MENKWIGNPCTHGFRVKDELFLPNEDGFSIIQIASLSVIISESNIDSMMEYIITNNCIQLLSTAILKFPQFVIDFNNPSNFTFDTISNIKYEEYVIHYGCKKYLLLLLLKLKRFRILNVLLLHPKKICNVKQSFDEFQTTNMGMSVIEYILQVKQNEKQIINGEFLQELDLKSSPLLLNILMFDPNMKMRYLNNESLFDVYLEKEEENKENLLAILDVCLRNNSNVIISGETAMDWILKLKPIKNTNILEKLKITEEKPSSSIQSLISLLISNCINTDFEISKHDFKLFFDIHNQIDIRTLDIHQMLAESKISTLFEIEQKSDGEQDIERNASKMKQMIKFLIEFGFDSRLIGKALLNLDISILHYLIYINDYQTFKWFVYNCGMNCNDCWWMDGKHNKYTCLDFVILSEKKEIRNKYRKNSILNFILEQGVNKKIINFVCDVRRVSCMNDIQFESQAMFILHFKNRKYLNYMNMKSKQELLVTAVDHQWLNVIQFLASDVNILDINALLDIYAHCPITPLTYISCKLKSVEMLKILLESDGQRCNPNVLNADGTTALCHCIRAKNFPSFHYLLDCKSNPSNICIYSSFTPLMIAVQEQIPEIVRSLCFSKMINLTINQKCELSGDTCFHIALQKCYFNKDIIQLLMYTMCIDISIENKKNETAFFIGVRNENEWFVKFFCEFYFDGYNKSKNKKFKQVISGKPLHTAIVDHKNWMIGEILFGCGCEQLPIGIGMEVINDCAKENNVKAIRILLENSIDLSHYRREEQNPLKIALKSRSISIVQLLCQYKRQISSILDSDPKCLKNILRAIAENTDPNSIEFQIFRLCLKTGKLDIRQCTSGVISTLNASLIEEFIYYTMKHSKKDFQFALNADPSPLQYCVNVQNWDILWILLQPHLGANASVSRIILADIMGNMNEKASKKDIKKRIDWRFVQLLIERNCNILQMSFNRYSVLSFVIHFHQNQILRTLFKHRDCKSLLKSRMHSPLMLMDENDSGILVGIELAQYYSYLDMIEMIDDYL